MPKSDYMPPRDAEFLRFHDNLKSQAQEIGVTLGITAADNTELSQDNAKLREVMEAAMDLESRAAQATDEKNRVRKAIEQRVRNFAKRLKLHSGYNAGFGEQLRIEGAEESNDLENTPPRLKADSEPHGIIVISFVKLSSDGVNIYSKRDAESDFTFLARDTNSPYVDNRPCLAAGKLETRTYKARYIQDDMEVGPFSDVVSVICQP